MNAISRMGAERPRRKVRWRDAFNRELRWVQREPAVALGIFGCRACARQLKRILHLKMKKRGLLSGFAMARWDVSKTWSVAEADRGMQRKISRRIDDDAKRSKN